MYLPRPDLDRVTNDVDEIYLLAAEALQRSLTPSERRDAFKTAMLRAYQAGTDAQREIIRDYDHERPTPLPGPMPTSNGAAQMDPGMLPPGPRPITQRPLPRRDTQPYKLPKKDD